jgi:hypothetical protein
VKVTIGNYPKSPKKERKVSVHIDRSDVWNMDHTLALIVVPMLKMLKEDKRGSPYVDNDDVPEHLRSIQTEPSYDTDETHHERWVWVLDEMIWAFEQHVDSEWETQYYSGDTDLYVDDNGFLCVGPNHTFSVDHDGQTAHRNRMKNGLRLFAKYYDGLWS